MNYRLMSEVVQTQVANLLAAVTLCTQTYSIIDRMVNSLSIDAVSRSIYEASRNLAVIKQQNSADYNIIEFEKDNKPHIKVTTKSKNKKQEYEFYGKLPSESTLKDFLELANKDIRIARTTAAYAMSIVAKNLGK